MTFDGTEQALAIQELTNALAALGQTTGLVPPTKGHLYEAWLYSQLCVELSWYYVITFERATPAGATIPTTQFDFGDAPSNLGSPTLRSHAVLTLGDVERFELHQSRYVIGRSGAPSDVDILITDRQAASDARAAGGTVVFNAVVAGATVKSYNIVKADAHLAMALQDDLGYRPICFAVPGTSSTNADNVLLEVGIPLFANARPSTDADAWSRWMAFTTMRDEDL